MSEEKKYIYQENYTGRKTHYYQQKYTEQKTTLPEKTKKKHLNIYNTGQKISTYLQK